MQVSDINILVEIDCITREVKGETIFLLVQKMTMGKVSKKQVSYVEEEN